MVKKTKKKKAENKFEWLNVLPSVVYQLVELRNWLQGKKTYILGLAVIGILVLAHFNIITVQETEYLLGIFGTGLLFTLKAGQNRLEQEIKKK